MSQQPEKALKKDCSGQQGNYQNRNYGQEMTTSAKEGTNNIWGAPTVLPHT